MNNHPDPDIGRYWPRIPYGDRIKADYKTDCPDALMGNPFYRVLPTPRSMDEVRDLIECKNPPFDPGIRARSASIRRQSIDDVGGCLFTTRRHRDLEDQINTTMRNAYRYRPFSYTYVKDVMTAAASIDFDSEVPTVCCGDSVGSGALIGPPGQGKTRSLERILMGCPQLIRHHQFNDCYLGITQVAWLCLSMPEKASASGLYLAIAAMLDDLIETDWRIRIQKEKNGPARLQRIVEALGLHAVGTIFLDEGQNMAIGPSDQRKEMESALMKLINHTYTRFVMVAAQRPEEFIVSEPLRRRMLGERGSTYWAPLFGEEWFEFMQRLWSHQVTREPAPPTKTIIELMHIITGGSPFLAKRLFTTVQSMIIARGGSLPETITPLALITACRDRFQERFAVVEPALKEYVLRHKPGEQDAGINLGNGI